MNWRTLIPKCLGRDMVFGGHPSDRKAAMKMLSLAAAFGATKKDIIDEIRRYLKGQGLPAAKITRQLRRAGSIENYLS